MSTWRRAMGHDAAVGGRACAALREHECVYGIPLAAFPEPRPLGNIQGRWIRYLGEARVLRRRLAVPLPIVAAATRCRRGVSQRNGAVGRDSRPSDHAASPSACVRLSHTASQKRSFELATIDPCRYPATPTHPSSGCESIGASGTSTLIYKGFWGGCGWRLVARRPRTQKVARRDGCHVV
ncbi:hypothetical protein GQ53DRAFT_754433 [Thozetella sp. PMI_491]|nr:hypothetical protein GQ53DRAFT_754433 [Thozetella sp. PMI_491]